MSKNPFEDLGSMASDSRSAKDKERKDHDIWWDDRRKWDREAVKRYDALVVKCLNALNDALGWNGEVKLDSIDQPSWHLIFEIQSKEISHKKDRCRIWVRAYNDQLGKEKDAERDYFFVKSSSPMHDYETNSEYANLEDKSISNNTSEEVLVLLLRKVAKKIVHLYIS